MWPRYKKNDFLNISYYLGTLLLFLGAIMLIPLVVSLFFHEFETSAHYLVGVGVALALGAALRLTSLSPGGLERKEAMAVVGSMWIITVLIGAIPLWLSGHFSSYLDALFESVSGFTATGLSLILDIDHLSMADQMWRFTMHFLGGQGVIVVALSMGVFARTGTSFMSAEAREEEVLPFVKRTAQFIWRFSAVVTLVGTLVVSVITLILGMEPLRAFFHALWFTIGSYDTGGFAPQSLSLMYYHSWPMEFVCMILMCMGAINFAIYARLWQGRWRTVLRDFLRDIELKTLVIWTVAILVLFTGTLIAGGIFNDLGTLVRRGVFTIVSASTNTGYQLFSTEQINTLFTSGAFMILILSLAIGGSIGSTAGGIKALRVGLVAKAVVARTRSLLSPSSIQDNTSYYHNGRRLLDNEAVNGAMLITLLFILSYVLGTVAGVVAGYDALSAVLESVSVASNAGLSSGISTAAAPWGLKVIYIVQMLLGRLEFFTILTLLAGLLGSLDPRRWRRA